MHSNSAEALPLAVPTEVYWPCCQQYRWAVACSVQIARPRHQATCPSIRPIRAWMSQFLRTRPLLQLHQLLQTPLLQLLQLGASG